jgi:hypothetical protein
VSHHPTYMLSLSDLLAERDALQELERRVDSELEKQVSEKDVEVRKRLDALRLTDESSGSLLRASATPGSASAQAAWGGG